MKKNRAKKVSMMTLLVFLFTIFMPAGLCLATKTEVFYETHESSIDTINMQTAWSFDDDEIITLTLSDGVFWYMDDNDFEDLEIEEVELIEISEDSRTISVEIIDDDCDEIDFERLKVATTPDVPLGDITVTIGGDFSASLVVGEVIHCAEIEAEAVAIDAGNPAQPAGEITLAETYKNSLEPLDNRLGTADGEWYIGLILPDGVGFSVCPQVYVNGIFVESSCYKECFRERKDKVFSGARGLESGDSECYIKIKETQYFGSGKMDTVTISDIQYEVSSDFPGGEIAVGISGDMVNKLLGAGDELVSDLESDNIDLPVYTVINATTEKQPVVHGEMTMGSRALYINGKTTVMDVSPYISSDRTYLPIRYAAYALGMDDSSIAWDGTTQTVTLTRGIIEVQMQVGSQILLVNDSEVVMDAVPEMKNDRVCLPIRYVAEAFGAEVGWNPLTLTVSIDV